MQSQTEEDKAGLEAFARLQALQGREPSFSKPEDEAKIRAHSNLAFHGPYSRYFKSVLKASKDTAKKAALVSRIADVFDTSPGFKNGVHFALREHDELTKRLKFFVSDLGHWYDIAINDPDGLMLRFEEPYRLLEVAKHGQVSATVSRLKRLVGEEEQERLNVALLNAQKQGITFDPKSEPRKEATKLLARHIIDIETQGKPYTSFVVPYAYEVRNILFDEIHKDAVGESDDGDGVEEQDEEEPPTDDELPDLDGDDGTTRTTRTFFDANGVVAP